jgi:hypothetical protein
MNRFHKVDREPAPPFVEEHKPWDLEVTEHKILRGQRICFFSGLTVAFLAFDQPDSIVVVARSEQLAVYHYSTVYLFRSQIGFPFH